MGAAVFLELLARDAAVVEYERPLVEARARRAPADEIDELEQAKRHALQVRAALERRRRREAELVALFDTAGEIAALQDLDAVLQAIVRRARRLLGTDVAYLTLKDPEVGDTYMRVTDGSVAASFQRVRLPLGAGLGGLVAQTATPVLHAQLPADDQFRHTAEIDAAVRDEGLVAILGVPLRLGSTVIGVLMAANRSERPFARDEVTLLGSLAAHAAVAIDNARLLQETRAALDELNTANQLVRAHSESVERAAAAHDRLADLVLRGGGVEDVGGRGQRRARRRAAGPGRRGPGRRHRPPVARRAGQRCRPAAAGGRAARVPGRAVHAGDCVVAAVAAGSEQLGALVLSGVPGLAGADQRILERAALVPRCCCSSAGPPRRRGAGPRRAARRPAGAPRRDPDSLRERARRLGVDLDTPHTVVVVDAGELPLGSGSRPSPPGWPPTARDWPARTPVRGAPLMPCRSATRRWPPRAVAQALEPTGWAARAHRRRGAASPVGRPGGVWRRRTRTPTAAWRRRCSRSAGGAARRGDGRPRLPRPGAGREPGRRRLRPVAPRPAVWTTTRAAAPSCSPPWSSTSTLSAAAWPAPARCLHVHVNTVAQRLERIGRLLGDDWNAPERALEVQLARCGCTGSPPPSPSRERTPSSPPLARSGRCPGGGHTLVGCAPPPPTCWPRRRGAALVAEHAERAEPADGGTPCPAGPGRTTRHRGLPLRLLRHPPGRPAPLAPRRGGTGLAPAPDGLRRARRLEVVPVVCRRAWSPWTSRPTCTPAAKKKRPVHPGLLTATASRPGLSPAASACTSGRWSTATRAPPPAAAAARQGGTDAVVAASRSGARTSTRSGSSTPEAGGLNRVQPPAGDPPRPRPGRVHPRHDGPVPVCVQDRPRSARPTCWPEDGVRAGGRGARAVDMRASPYDLSVVRPRTRRSRMETPAGKAAVRGAGSGGCRPDAAVLRAAASSTVCAGLLGG